MSLRKILDHYSSYENIPIKVSDIRDSIIDYGFQDEIEFIESNIDDSILRGIFKQFNKHKAVYGEPIRVTHIYYPRTANNCWRRFICCKELMHIFDSVAERTCSEKDVIHLVESLSFSHNPQYTENTTPDLVAEARAFWLALCVLVPDDFMDKLKNSIENNQINDELIYDVANQLKIPSVFVPILFKEEYREFRKKLFQD